MKITKRIKVLGMFIWIATVSVVWAHGTNSNHSEDGMSTHMQDMYALKEKIPLEFRIMERSPIYPDKESLREGQKYFAKNCAICHGAMGNGKGPATASMATPPANFLDSRHSSIYGPGEKYWIIENGTGKTGMPGFQQIKALDRWHLVNYILYLQQKDTVESTGHNHHE